MARDELDVFARFARDYCTVMLEAEHLSLSQRVFGLYSALSGVLAAGSTLPVVPGRKSGRGPLESFPGLGVYEEYWTVGALKAPGSPVPLTMTGTLSYIFHQLWSGLEKFDGGEREAAAGTWGLGFETTWGIAASELVHALHPVVAAYRADLRQDETKDRSITPVLVQNQAAAPEQEDAAPSEGGLGVQFVPVPGGLEVADVSAIGLAAGKLRPGDLVIGVNGQSLDELSETGLEGLPLKFEIFRDGETLYIKVG